MSEEITIPEFTREQYEQTQAPYAWLYEHRENKFLLKVLQNKMKDKAGALGVRTFVSMFKAYCEAMAARDPGVKLDNATQFTGQTIELMSGEYTCDDDGVRKLDRMGYPVTVCPHPIMPIRRLVNVDGTGERLELEYRKGYAWRSAIVQKSVIASSNRILELANNGVVVNSENAKALSSYIFDIENMNYDLIPEVKSVGRLGWIQDHGFSPYVEGLQFDGEDSFKQLFNSVREEGEYGKWLEAIKAVRQERTPARFFLAASFASALVAPCNQLPFFAHAYGRSGTGKTVGLMIAASVWGNPDYSGGYISTFNSTNTAMELRASFLNSLPMCIDELQIQVAGGNTKFDDIIMTLTEGIPKGRGTKEGGLKGQSGWKNCIITSGEQPITNSSSIAGAMNRVIEFECDKEIYSDCQGLSVVLKQNYGHAGRVFVEFLQDEDNMKRAIETQKAYFRSLLDAGSTDKQAASAAVLLTAEELADEIFFHDGCGLTQEDIVGVMKSAESVDVGKRAYDYLMAEVSARRAAFYPKRDYDPSVAVMLGKLLPDDLPPGAFHNAVWFVPGKLDAILKEGGFNTKILEQYCIHNDLMVHDKDRPNRKTVSFEGIRQKGICIMLPQYDADSQNDDANELPF